MLTAESIDVKDPDGGNTQDMGDLEKPAKPADTPSNKKKSKETGGLGKDENHHTLETNSERHQTLND